MCLRIPEDQKKHSLQGILPDGWTFAFSDDKGYKTANKKQAEMHTCIDGLCIFKPKCKKRYRSIEAAVRKSKTDFEDLPNAITDFNRHIGAVDEGGSESLKVARAQDARRNVSTSSKALNHKKRPSGSTRNDPSSSKSMSKYRKVGSRVCYMAGNREHWGVIEARVNVTPTVYEYTVSVR